MSGSKTRPTRPVRERNLSREFDAFMADVAEVVSLSMRLGRWADLHAAIEAYARAAGLEPGRLFHGSLVHRLARHALSLADRDQFAVCLSALHDELRKAESGRPLTDSLDAYRAALARRPAVEAFRQISNKGEGSAH